MAFDPCREWLGIDAVELGNPGRVLGLPPGCNDPTAISGAADARLESLRRIAPGPFAKAHAALVARIEEVRDTLLAAAFLDGRSAEAPEPPSSFAPLPPPLARSTSGWVGAEDAPDAPARLLAEAEDDRGPGPSLTPTVRHTTTQSRRSSGAGGLLLTSFVLLASSAAVLLYLMLLPDPSTGEVAVNQPPASPASNGSQPAAEPGQEPSRQPDPPADDAGAGDRFRAERDAERRGTEEAQRPQAEQRRPGGRTEEQASRDAEMAERKAVAAARDAEEARRAEMAANEAQRQAEQERTRMQEALDKSLRDAYGALQRGEFDTADRAINAAGDQVGDDVAAATRIESWRLFATYAREFTNFRERAFAAANAGRDYQIDGKPFAIVEIGPDLLVYRWDGQNKRISRDQVPPRIELAVVEGWFKADGRAANHLFLGARWLTLDPPNPARAKAEWRIAGDGGEQVAPLNALLDDPVIRRAGR